VNGFLEKRWKGKRDSKKKLIKKLKVDN